MPGFWSSETLERELPNLIVPYNPSRVTNCAYELSMGQQACVTSSGTKQAHSRSRVALKEFEQVTIPPGQFAQLLVYENIEIPANAVGLISMKSTIKMRGLVNVSGFHVDPGYEGKLKFAVFNAGSQDIVIRQGDPTFLLWYVSLDQTTNDIYSGSRQHVEDITAEDQMNLRGPTYNPTALADRVSRIENRYGRWRAINVTVGAGLILLWIDSVVEAVDFAGLIGKLSERL